MFPPTQEGALQPVINLLSSVCPESQREAALLLGQFATQTPNDDGPGMILMLGRGHSSCMGSCGHSGVQQPALRSSLQASKQRQLGCHAAMHDHRMQLS